MHKRGDTDNLEVIVLEGQRLGVCFHEFHIAAEAASLLLLTCHVEHFGAKIGSYHGHFSLGIGRIGQRQIACACADIENGKRAIGGYVSHGLASPPAIDVE